MTRQEQKGLIENVVSLLEGVHEKTHIDINTQKTVLEILTNVLNDNRLNRTRLIYVIEKLNELKTEIIE